MITRFQTRAFLLCFVPFSVLLAGSFWMIHRHVQTTVRDGLLTSMRENQNSIARIHAKSDLENNRFLKVAGENAALKAGMQLLLQYPDSATASRTVEDQLRELCEHMGFDLLLVSAGDGRPMAGVVRQAGQGQADRGQLVPMDISVLGAEQPGSSFWRATSSRWRLCRWAQTRRTWEFFRWVRFSTFLNLQRLPSWCTKER